MESPMVIIDTKQQIIYSYIDIGQSVFVLTRIKKSSWKCMAGYCYQMFSKYIISIELKLTLHLLIQEHTHIYTYTIKVIYDVQSNWIQIDLEKKCSRFFSNTVPLSISYNYTIALGNVIGSNNNFTFFMPNNH